MASRMLKACYNKGAIYMFNDLYRLSEENVNLLTLEVMNLLVVNGIASAADRDLYRKVRGFLDSVAPRAI